MNNPNKNGVSTTVNDEVLAQIKAIEQTKQWTRAQVIRYLIEKGIEENGKH